MSLFNLDSHSESDSDDEEEVLCDPVSPLKEAAAPEATPLAPVEEAPPPPPAALSTTSAEEGAEPRRSSRNKSSDAFSPTKALEPHVLPYVPPNLSDLKEGEAIVSANVPTNALVPAHVLPYVPPNLSDLKEGEAIISANLYPPALGHSTSQLPELIANDPESIAVFEAAKSLKTKKEDVQFAVPGYEHWVMAYKMRQKSNVPTGDLYIWPPGEDSGKSITHGSTKSNVLRSLGQLIEALLIQYEARSSGGVAWRPPDPYELVHVEVCDGHVEKEGVAEWRRAHVRRVLPDGRFMVCVHTPFDEPDEEFMEWYTRHDENVEWARLPDLPDGTRPMFERPQIKSNKTLRIGYKRPVGDIGHDEGGDEEECAVADAPGSSGGRGSARQQNEGRPKKAPTAYNLFVKAELAKIRREHPGMDHKDAFRLAASRWADAPQNPKSDGQAPVKRAKTFDAQPAPPAPPAQPPVEWIEASMHTPLGAKATPQTQALVLVGGGGGFVSSGALAPPPPDAPPLAEEGMAAVTEMLTRFRLERYVGAFDEAGYDDALYLLQMSGEQIEQLIKDVGMKMGHASKFRDFMRLEHEMRVEMGQMEPRS